LVSPSFQDITDVGSITIETDTKTFDNAYCADHPGFVPGDFVLLTVGDDGCGMDKQTQEHLFEPLDDRVNFPWL